MAGRTAVLAVRIITDAKQAKSEVQDFDRTAGKAGSSIGGKLKAGAGVALGGIALLGKTALDAASDLQQATGAAQSVFGKYAADVIKKSKGAADAVGLSQAAFLQQSTLLGSQLKNLGTPMDQVSGQTDKLIGKASDLAATFGGSTAEAVEAIGSLLRGERDPIERYGVSINQASIDAYEAARGLKGLTGQAKKNADAQATLAILTKQTAAATGQFKRETNTAAGASEIATAKLENAKAALGKRLLPVYAKFKAVLASVATWVSKNSGLVFTLAGVIGGAAVVILGINAATKAWAAATRAMAAVQTVLNVVMNASPMARIALAVLAVGAALVIAYKKSATFRAIVKGAFDAVMAVVRPFVDFFTDTIPEAFRAVVDGLHSAWNNVVGFLKVWGPRALIVLAPFIGIPLLIARHFRQIVGWLRDVWNNVVGGAKSFVTTLVNAILSIPGRIGSLAKRMLSVGASFISSFFRGIGDVVSKTGNFASTIAHSVVNAIVKGLNAILDLPWEIKIHIPIPWAPDVNFGPYTVLPRIPLWSSAPPAASVPGPQDVPGLMPGWSIMAAGVPRIGSGWTAQIATPNLDNRANRTVIKAIFTGLVTDPEGVARQIRQLARQSDDRRGVSRTAVVAP